MPLLDTDSIREIGLENFSSIYYWPISESDFEVFCHGWLYDFDQVLVDTDRDIFDLVIADYRFLMFVIQHIHHNAALARFDKFTNSDTRYGSTFTAIVRPDWDEHVRYFHADNFKTGHFGNYRNTAMSQIGGRIRHAAKTIACNHNYNLVTHFSQLLRAPRDVSIGPVGSFKKCFLRSRKEHVRVIEWDYFGLPQTRPDRTFLPRLNNQFLAPFLERLRMHSTNLGAEINVSLIAQAWKQRLVRLNGFYCGYRSIRKVPERIFVSAAGNPVRKVLSTALQKEGTKVYVLHHGECAGVERYPHAHRNDGSYCDFFVCPNDRITENFRANYSDSVLEKRVGTRYISSKSSHYKDLSRTYRSRKRSDENNTVMLIGYPMANRRTPDCAGYFFYFQLDLQFRIAKLIRRCGYRVIYKVHPGRLTEVGELFSECSDYVESRPFEEVWDTADSYVFTIPGTTVFGNAVLTEKPMLLVDLHNNNWNKTGYELLQSRCQMVSSHFDSDNRIVFDESEFVEKLGNPLPLNDSYINHFFI